MEIWVMTIIFVLSFAYCCDIPAIKGFEFLIHQKDSMVYGVGCGFIAAYVFYVIYYFFNKKVLTSKTEKKNSTKERELVTTFRVITVAIMLICWVIIQLGIEWHSKGMKDAALGFAGSIIGGGIGFLGVVMTILFTIEEQKQAEIKRDQERREDFSIQYRPILQIVKRTVALRSAIEERPKYEYDDKIEDYIIVSSEDILHKWFNVNIKLKNIGRGEILEAHAKCMESDEYINVSYEKKFSSVFPKDSFWIYFRIDLKAHEKFIYENYDSTVEVEIKYFDCMKKEGKITIPIHLQNIPASYSINDDKVEYSSDNDITCHIGSVCREPVL